MKLSKEEFGKVIGYVEYLAWDNREERKNLKLNYKDEKERENALEIIKAKGEAINILLQLLYNMDEEV